jgi:hypothetical protein
MINQLRNMNVLDKIDLKIVHYFLHQSHLRLSIFLTV